MEMDMCNSSFLEQRLNGVNVAEAMEREIRIEFLFEVGLYGGTFTDAVSRALLEERFCGNERTRIAVKKCVYDSDSWWSVKKDSWDWSSSRSLQCLWKHEPHWSG
jgi:hypothetical protein